MYFFYQINPLLSPFLIPPRQIFYYIADVTIFLWTLIIVFYRLPTINMVSIFLTDWKIPDDAPPIFIRSSRVSVFFRTVLFEYPFLFFIYLKKQIRMMNLNDFIMSFQWQSRLHPASPVSLNSLSVDTHTHIIPTSKTMTTPRLWYHTLQLHLFFHQIINNNLRLWTTNFFVPLLQKLMHSLAMYHPQQLWIWKI